MPQSRAPNVLTYFFMHPFIHPAKPALTAYQALLQTLSASSQQPGGTGTMIYHFTGEKTEAQRG